MNCYRVGEISETLMVLAELLSEDDCEITAEELLENITGSLISEENAGQIKQWLNA